MSNDLPVVLVVEQESGDLKSPSRLLQSLYRVVTCPVESVALEYVSESRPEAVLLNADALYLEGSGIVQRWRTASPGTRILFVDTDGPWVVLMELAEEDSGQVTINPCAIDGIASAVEELLGRGADARKEYQDDRMAFLAV